MQEHRLKLLEPRVGDGVITVASTFSSPGSGDREYWFRLPESLAPSLTNSADPFLLSCIFEAMRSGGTLVVKGAVSPPLIDGLQDFMRAWQKWCPDQYQCVEIEYSEEAPSPAAGSDRTLIPFSGGLDSCHSLWNFLQRSPATENPPISAVMVHGFDIPIADKSGFQQAFDNSKRILDSVGVEGFAVASNIREYKSDWEMEHGAALASVLHLFAGHYSRAIIASSHAYDTLRFPWGSNPLTDPLLSSDSLQITYDGLAWSRNEKAKAVSNWDAAMENLRPCWKNSDYGSNCGSCVRCIGTALCFACEGITPPKVLNVPSLDAAIEQLAGQHWTPAAALRLSDSALEPARRNHIDDPWVASLEKVISRKLGGGFRQRSMERAASLYRKIAPNRPA